MNKIALFDMDNTLCNYSGAMESDLKLMLGPDEKMHDIHEHCPDYFVKRMSLIKLQPGWWKNLPPIESGFAVMRIAYEIGFDIHILTKGPDTKPTAWKEKFEWCHEWIRRNEKIPCKVTITQDKSCYYGRVLVDDWPEYAFDWLKHRPRGLVLMPDRYYNVRFNTYSEQYNHPNVIRFTSEMDNKEQITKTLKEAYTRK